MWRAGALVLVDEQGVRVQIPAGGVACLLLEPGVTLTHAAVVLAAGCGTRFFGWGRPGCACIRRAARGRVPTKLLYQARLALEDGPRLQVVRAMYRFRFGEEPPARRSVEQLRGIEGARVRALYQQLAKRHGLEWKRRNYDPKDWDAADPLNQAVSVANHCLYGVCEAAVLAAGYAPAIGFIHTGKPLSFVYDIADLFKFDTVIPAAFQSASRKSDSLARDRAPAAAGICSGNRKCCPGLFRSLRKCSRPEGSPCPRLRQRPCRWPFRKQRDWAMLVIVTEAVPERLRGYLSRWLLEVRAGVYVGSYSVRVRERLWRVVCAETGEGNAVLIWKADHESGFEFVTVGRNARRPVDWDGIRLVAYDPVPKLGTLEVDGKE